MIKTYKQYLILLFIAFLATSCNWQGQCLVNRQTFSFITNIIRGDGIVINSPSEDVTYNNTGQITSHSPSFEWQKDWLEASGGQRKVLAGQTVEIKTTGVIYTQKQELSLVPNNIIKIPGSLIRLNSFTVTTGNFNKGDLIIIKFAPSVHSVGFGIFDQTPSMYPSFDITSYSQCKGSDISSFKNCVILNGMGIKIQENSTIIKPIELPFGSSYNAAQEADQSNILDSNNNSYEYHMHIMQNNGPLVISGSAEDLNNNSNVILGNFNFKITRYTDPVQDGEKLIVKFGSDPTDDQKHTDITPNANFVAPFDGNLWFKFDNPNNLPYFGKYYIDLTVKNAISNTSFSTWLNNTIIQPIKTSVVSGAMVTYNQAVKNQGYIKIVKLMLVLSVIMYGIFFLMGYIQDTKNDLVMRILKITFISILISEDSWQFFFDHLFSVMLNFTDEMIVRITNSNNVNPFSFIDATFNKYFNNPYIFLSALSYLAIAGGYGLIIIVLLLYAFVVYGLVILKIIGNYLINMILISFLVAIAPIFIACILFQQTKKLFDEWLKAIFYLAFQPVLSIVCFMIINQIIDAFALNLLDPNLCWQKYIEIKMMFLGQSLPVYDIPFILPPSFIPITINLLDWIPGVNVLTALDPTVLGPKIKPFIGNFYNIFINLTIFLILVNLADDILNFSGRLAALLLGDSPMKESISGLSKSVQVVEQGKQLAKGLVNMASSAVKGGAEGK